MNRTVMIRIVLIAGLCLAAVMGLSMALTKGPTKLAPAPAGASASIGGPFHLVDQTGKPVTEAILKGKWSAVFFGYTYCPDVCPTTLQNLARVKTLLGPKADQLQIVFVSIDPERDTPKVLATYLASQGFPAGVIGLTGTQSQVNAAAAKYRVYIAKQGTGDTYTMDHTAITYLMNPQGQLAAALGYGDAPKKTADDILAAMRGQ